MKKQKKRLNELLYHCVTRKVDKLSSARMPRENGTARNARLLVGFRLTSNHPRVTYTLPGNPRDEGPGNMHCHNQRRKGVRTM
eukprot:747834-Amphidinium_carterae.1